MTLRKLLQFLLGATVVLIVGFGTYLTIYQLQSNQIRASYDTSLFDYYESRDIAKSYLAVFAITDESSFNEAKQLLSGRLSSSLRNSIFGADKYTGVEGNSTSYTVDYIAGEFSSNSNYIFKVVGTFTTGGTSIEKSVLVTVENKFITQVRGI